MKILSIVVPSYNAATYLPDTLPTILSVPNLNLLEILIVNDGSKDNTLEIGNQFAEKYPSIVKVINKENGGHGSAINVGIKEATGKYFKIIDADDWVDSNNLAELIEYLEGIDDDEVISPFVKVYMDTNTKEVYSYSPNYFRQTYMYDNFLSEIKELPKMHSITIKTNILKDNNINIDENCFYVDLEYNTFPMPYIKKVSYFEKPIYQYRLGSLTQSVSIDNYIRNVDMHQRVIFALIRFYNAYKNITRVEKKLLENLIYEVISIHANIFLSKKNASDSKKEFIIFEDQVKNLNNLFIENTKGKKLKILRLSNYWTFNLISFITKLRNKK